ncbi:binding-protein-dependent transport systems inner membrane component [Beutenbergia cavernae DSM 12333]|uniref:Binding-protein-dependent transport systems inner membrane component n=1 Tax=Beutenbergia cavernae (strain ATCC BAA-8 / DSM 12333 / CCUG 43141 / JCM 11478 / NBRC 16432 / NCIMB 13614 / HKI 0122) TaxID=471853 RepID=C5C5E3_BEUC1|nr:carbohydrate ABC transporter permease [Beutenbergia cavernae]ACQ82283.1 binding-protein-dependent transport systems inner membrane component [Beutenbergia cavernae DSM 12333]
MAATVSTPRTTASGQELRPSPRRPVWMGRPSAGIQAGKALLIAVIVVIMLYPFLYVIAMSFASREAAAAGGFFPNEFSLEAYRSVLGGNVVTRALLVSIGITLVGTALSMLFTTTLAYGLMRTREVPGAKFVLVAVLCTMLFGAGIIPNYLLIRSLGLLDTYWALILPGLISAFNMVVVRNFFMGLPNELLESARIDGASDWRIFTGIILPLSKAVLAVVGLFYAVGYWNAFFNALIYLNDTSKWPIQVVLNQYVVQGSALTSVQAPDIPPPPPATVQMAIIVLATIPILIVYPFLQRYFTKGVLTGAIKG